MTAIGAELTRVYTADELATSGRGHRPGDHYTDNDGKKYKFVKYDDGTGALDLVAGDVVYYVDATGYSAHTVTADVSDASGAELGAGVAMAAVTVDGSYFWVQTRGAATVSTALGGTAGDGDPLTCVGASDKALTKAAEADSTGVYKSVVAFAQDASAKTIVCAFPD